jgi:hypothetical protein
LGDEVEGRQNIEVDYFYKIQIAFIDDDHVAGERLRSELWPPNGPIVHPIRDIWVWGTMVECYRQGKTPDLYSRALWQSYQQSHLAAAQEELGKEIMNLTLRSVIVMIRMVL